MITFCQINRKLFVNLKHLRNRFVIIMQINSMQITLDHIRILFRIYTIQYQYWLYIFSTMENISIVYEYWRCILMVILSVLYSRTLKKKGNILTMAQYSISIFSQEPSVNLYVDNIGPVLVLYLGR